MDVVFDRVAGLDIGKKIVVVCVRTPGERGRRRSEIRTFRTMTRHVEVLGDWLVSEGVQVAAMESTATYWKPVFYGLEDRVECWLLNARAHEGGAGAQDRRARRGVDRAAGRARPGAALVRATAVGAPAA